MKPKRAPGHENARPSLLLGVEGGGTKTVALSVDENGLLLNRIETGPGNVRLISDNKLLALFQEIGKRTDPPCSIAIGMAGARTENDRARIRNAAQKVWPGIPCVAANDLETGLAAAEEEDGERAPSARILVISGTGSCCYGKNNSGKTVKVGGWGHILGDQGSGYAIGMAAIRSVLEQFDATGKWPGLGERLLRKLLLNEPNDLIQWAQTAGKDDVAQLSAEVFDALKQNDGIARRIVTEAAGRLACDAESCAKRLTQGGRPVSFFLSGGILLNQSFFANSFAGFLRKLRPGCRIRPLTKESVWGAVHLAASGNARVSSSNPPMQAVQTGLTGKQALELIESPTEKRNPRSMHLDKMSIHEAMELMLSEDSKIPAAILEQQEPIKKAVELIVRKLKKGGRLFYAGAGTSGRLGVLDASECPPTFRTDPDQVQGIIAGGQRALWQAVEGAEDDREAGERAVIFRGAGAKDIVIGIAASGRTPFVHGALAEAKRRKSATILLAFNPNIQLQDPPDILIAVNVGPEILTGSTRLKSGTATKMILNMLTTIAMVRLGKVIGNLMIDLNPSNIKLRDRAVRIVSDLTGASREKAQSVLSQNGWIVAEACKQLSLNRKT